MLAPMKIEIRAARPGEAEDIQALLVSEAR
jgi:hypothetical protein